MIRYLALGLPGLCFLVLLSGSPADAQTLTLKRDCLEQKDETIAWENCGHLLRQGELEGMPLFHALHKHAWALQRLGNHDRALKSYNQAIALLPYQNKRDRAAILVNRGRTYHLKKHYELALKDFNKALKLQPFVKSGNRVALAYLLRANTNKADGRFASAILDAERARELATRPSLIKRINRFKATLPNADD